MMNSNWLAFIEGMLDAVWLVDPIDLCIIAANQPAADMIGVTHNWLIGKPVVDLACTDHISSRLIRSDNAQINKVDQPDRVQHPFNES